MQPAVSCILFPLILSLPLFWSIQLKTMLPLGCVLEAVLLLLVREKDNKKGQNEMFSFNRYAPLSPRHLLQCVRLSISVVSPLRSGFNHVFVCPIDYLALACIRTLFSNSLRCPFTLFFFSDSSLISPFFFFTQKRVKGNHFPRILIFTHATPSLSTSLSTDVLNAIALIMPSPNFSLITALYAYP